MNFTSEFSKDFKSQSKIISQKPSFSKGGAVRRAAGDWPLMLCGEATNPQSAPLTAPLEKEHFFTYFANCNSKENLLVFF